MSDETYVKGMGDSLSLVDRTLRLLRPHLSEEYLSLRAGQPQAGTPVAKAQELLFSFCSEVSIKYLTLAHGRSRMLSELIF